MAKLLHTAAVSFEAARQVRNLPTGHRSQRLHGHGFVAKVRAALPPAWSPFPGGEVDELRVALKTALAPLDYSLLNDTLPVPSDENLARWVCANLLVPGVEAIGIHSTAREGTDLDELRRAHLWRRYPLQAAHRLPNVAPGHKCGRVHGHGFGVVLHAELGDSSSRPSALEDALDRRWGALHAELDHRYLNEIPGLENPTSEMISSWIWARVKPDLPQLSWVTVYETDRSGAAFDGATYRIWKEATLDSATCLPHAPAADPRRRVHGHTYTLRLHLSAPLDQVMGWIVDFGDVKTLFDPVFARIDHQPLHELDGLEQADCASLAQWLRREAEQFLPQLHRIDLEETKGCGVILAWDARDLIPA